LGTLSLEFCLDPFNRLIERLKIDIKIKLFFFQIIQMVIGGITVYCAHVWRNDGDCKTSTHHVLYGSIMYGSYFILFVHFFYITYVKKQPIRIKVSLCTFFFYIAPTWKFIKT